MTHVYHGTSEGIGYDLVTVTRNGETKALVHHVRHSPSGFSWGYAGSGPSDLARCILADHLGLAPLGTRRAIYGVDAIPEIDGLYHQFKFDVIARLPKDGGSWTLTGEDVETWLAGHPPLRVCPAHRVEYDDDDGTCFYCTTNVCTTCEGDGVAGDGSPCLACDGLGRNTP